MDAPERHAQPPTRMLAGALAHLAQHMESGCPRAAYLAAMLLEQVAADAQADTHLRQHARQLIEILERDPLHTPASDIATAVLTSRQLPGKKRVIAPGKRHEP